jgi:GT2 family glycosyltransferase/peptidoglycan/xylan/chitin deacetylase (PgdA/CDA1 family)
VGIDGDDDIDASSPSDLVVSIVSHENREQLLTCVASLTGRSSERYRIEIVVLDNASSDGSVEAVAARFPEVRLLAQPYRAGFGENHNAVITSTSSRYVLVLNDDSEVEVEALEALIAYLDEHPQIGALGPRLTHELRPNQPSAWRFPTPASCALWAVTLATVQYTLSHTEETRPVGWLSGSALVLRREALERAGLFDDQIYMYMEDTDLCRRIWDAGYEVWFHPAVRILHLGWGSTSSIPRRRTNELWRSRMYYWGKHHSAGGRLAARTFDGLRYSFGAVIAAAVRLAPRRFQPRPIVDRREALPQLLLWNARNAFFGVRGPGIRELALAHNVARARGDVEPATTDGAVDQPTGLAPRRPTLGVAKTMVTHAQVGLSRANGKAGAPEPGLRVLNYHRVADDRDQLAIGVERFRRQLELVARSGYQVVDLTSVDLELARTRPLLVFSFDDGCRDVVDNALPLLSQHGWPAVVFVVPHAVDRLVEFPWYRRSVHPPLVRWDEMRDLERLGLVRFEPHTLTHPRLPALSDDEAREEIAGSKAVVEERLGRPAEIFCYPGGYAAPRERALVEEAGFRLALTCEGGLNRVPFDRLALRRTHVDRYDSAWMFAARLAGATDRSPIGRRTRAVVTETA